MRVRPVRDLPVRHLSALLLPLLFGSGIGRSSAAVRQPGLDIARLDRFVESAMRRNGLPGLALAITHGDRIVYLKGYGTSGAGRPVTPDTQFHVASLSKSVTALAVMQQVEDGRLDLDAPVRTYLPRFTVADHAVAARITVRHLLNQTSGLADRSLWEMGPPQEQSIPERVETLRRARPVSEPGEEFHYTDANYAVLAPLVEVAGGQPFSEYLRSRIFQPLGMTDTTSAVTSVRARQVAPSLAQGHVIAFGAPIARTEPIGYLGGSSGVISTARDMARFLIMEGSCGKFGGRSLLSPQGVDLMHTPPPGIDSDYAMGWTLVNGDSGPRTIEHNGILSTFYAHQVLLPESGYGMVFLTNAYHALAGFEGIKRGLVALLTGGVPSIGLVGARTIGWVFGGLTFLTAAVRIRSLLRLRRWAYGRVRGHPWRAVPGLLWLFLPAAVLGSLPWVVAAFTDRVFGYGLLFLAMPDVLTWLSVVALSGIAVGVGRILAFANARSQVAASRPRRAD